MKSGQIATKIFLLFAFLALPFATLQAQAADAAPMKIDGVIVSRDGDNLQIRGAGGDVAVVAVNSSTHVVSEKGFLVVLTSSDPATTASLIPGLKVRIEATSNGKQNVATSVKFLEEDLHTANAIQAALAVPQQQVKTLNDKVKQQDQVIAAQQQQNAQQQKQLADAKAEREAQAQQIAEAKAQREEFTKRFGDLGEYDMKSETNVYFDVNSTNLSQKSKDDLQALATTAKTFKGYLIQVAGHADSFGTEKHNNTLSDKRASAVATYLQQSCDVAISRVLAPIAMGESKPVNANDTAQSRAENRRVTVKIMVNRGIPQDAAPAK